MQSAHLYTVGAYAAGLAITLFLAAYLTPRAWWRRPNARALLIILVGAWGFGSLILYFAQEAPPGSAEAEPVPASAATPTPAAALIAGQPFQVHRDLNLRAAAGVDTARLVTVPAGAVVTPTGARDGDWWQVTVGVDGHQKTGWVSSLWLRRGGE